MLQVIITILFVCSITILEDKKVNVKKAMLISHVNPVVGQYKSSK
jgi:hypothetical protein